MKHLIGCTRPQASPASSNASLSFSPVPVHPWTSSLRSIAPLLSSLLVIRPASFNLLPLWVGCTSGTYFAGGTIPLFTPCTGRYEETLTICFHQQKQPVSVNMQACSTTTLQRELWCEGNNLCSSAIGLVCICDDKDCCEHLV